jgi:hypothetical protein
VIRYEIVQRIQDAGCAQGSKCREQMQCQADVQMPVALSIALSTRAAEVRVKCSETDLSCIAVSISIPGIYTSASSRLLLPRRRC